MKRNILFVFIIQTILISSCKKDEVKPNQDDFIHAGQKNGTGIAYFDFEPDNNFTINNQPITLDLNKDGIDDFSMYGYSYSASLGASDIEFLHIVPLQNNEVCINSETKWLEKIPHLETINSNKDWTNDETLLLAYITKWGSSNTRIEGYWNDITTNEEYYIGFRILKDEKTMFGWIGMKRDTSNLLISVLLTDYAFQNTM